MSKTDNFVPFKTSRKAMKEAQKRLDKEIIIPIVEDDTVGIIEELEETPNVTFRSYSKLLNKTKKRKQDKMR